jgi:GntR family transcriptional regulator
VDQLPLRLSDASGIPYYRQIVDQTAELIRSGRLAPGSQLPSVRELASQLLVSLITTRRAYADLEAAGLLVRRQGSGTFVAEEVGTATREQALSEAQQALGDAVARARRLGVEDVAIRRLVEEALTMERTRDEHSN